MGHPNGRAEIAKVATMILLFALATLAMLLVIGHSLRQGLAMAGLLRQAARQCDDRFVVTVTVWEPAVDPLPEASILPLRPVSRLPGAVSRMRPPRGLAELRAAA